MTQRRNRRLSSVDVGKGAAAGVGLHVAAAHTSPLGQLGAGVPQALRRAGLLEEGRKFSSRGARGRVARQLANVLPKGNPYIRRGLKTLSRGRRMTMYHATPSKNVGGILSEGLRQGRGSTFEPLSKGAIFVGKPLTVLTHNIFGAAGVTGADPQPMKNLAVRMPSRARMVRDWNHAGAYEVRHPKISAKLIREVTPRHLAMRSLPGVGRAAVLGATAAAVIHRRRQGRR